MTDPLLYRSINSNEDIDEDFIRASLKEAKLPPFSDEDDSTLKALYPNKTSDNELRRINEAIRFSPYLPKKYLLKDFNEQMERYSKIINSKIKITNENHAIILNLMKLREDIHLICRFANRRGQPLDLDLLTKLDQKLQKYFEDHKNPNLALNEFFEKKEHKTHWWWYLDVLEEPTPTEKTTI
jgi:hypothetical protein